jgi:hypothetical protein
MTPKIENFLFVEACLHWTFRALTDISFLNKARSTKEIELVNGPPFHFYRISLHYMFTMEYIKLTEADNERYPQNHYASLEKLSNTICKMDEYNFRESHEANIADLTTIKSSDFYKKLKGERDTKFAHTDGGCLAPFSFNSFSDLEIQEAHKHLDLFGFIIERCTSVFDYSFAFQHADNRTDNFIKFHTNYKEYYFSHYFDAISKGFH